MWLFGILGMFPDLRNVGTVSYPKILELDRLTKRCNVSNLEAITAIGVFVLDGDVTPICI